jgi:hypothetical protein
LQAAQPLLKGSIVKITCNRVGGYNIHGIDIVYGENEVDAKAWAEAEAKCIPAWLAAIKSGDPPDIVVHGETGGQRVVVDRFPLSVDVKIAKIESCDDLKQVEAMAAGELRVPVLEAIDRRIDQLELR